MSEVEESRKKRQKTGGRTKGTPNKFTSDVRQMVLEALDESGGVTYLVTQARERPELFFALLGKAMPANVQADIQGRMVLTWES